jgi:hypothetical protein
MRARKSSAAKLTVGGLFQLNFPQSGAEGVLCRVKRLALPTPGQSEATVSLAEDTGFFKGDCGALQSCQPWIRRAESTRLP